MSRPHVVGIAIGDIEMRDEYARSRIVRVSCRPLRSICGAGILCLLIAPTVAHGDDAAQPEPSGDGTPGLRPNRDEFLPVPNVGGNSDTGVQLGVAGSYVRFREGYYPYRFRLDGVISASFKVDSRGLRVVQQYHTVRIDLPQFPMRRVRLDVRADFLRLVDATWFGIGNATTVDPRPVPPDAASANAYIAEHVRMSAGVRIKTDTPFELAFMTHTRYEFPDPYVASKLADDLRSGTVIGGESALLETLSAGIVVDTRDSEFMPRHGIFYQAGMAGTIGAAESVRFGEGSATLTHFASLSRAFILGNRIIGSMKFGNVPYYELQQGGVFDPQYLVGGNGGVRGVRLGRYAGLVKAITNTDLRILPLPRLHVLSWSVLAGATVFFDAGRVWSDYSFHSPEDGSGLGLKYGTGAGVFFQWDEANLFRIDAAYSPDESGRGFPVSFYFQSGFQF